MNAPLLGTLALLSSTVLAVSPEVAKVNSRVITLDEFERKYQENLKFFQTQPINKAKLLDDLIKRELAIQEAKKLGLDKDPEIIDRMNTVLYQSLIERKLGKEMEKLDVSESEAKAHYEKFPEVRTSHIFVAVRPAAPAAEDKKAKEKIQKIYDEFIKPGQMGFAEIAQRYSEGVAAPMGGDIDYQNKDKLDPTYYDTALKLRSPGKVSSIIRSQFGYHIIKLTAIRSWDEADHALVKRFVFEEKRTAIFEKYMGQLRAQAKVQTNPSLLK